MKCCYSKLIGYTRGTVTIKGAVIYQSLRYRISPNFQGAKFSRIGRLKHFAEINFTDQEFAGAEARVSPMSHSPLVDAMKK